MSSSSTSSIRTSGNIWKLSVWFLVGSLFCLSHSCSAFAPSNGHVASTTVRTFKDTSSSLVAKPSSSGLGSFRDYISRHRSSLSVASDSIEEEVDDSEVIIPSDYRLGIEFLLIGLVLDVIPYVQWILGLPVTLLGILFAVQASRVQFVFTKDAFELRSGSDDDGNKEVGENIVVGGENVWSYDSFVNWEFFPKGWIDQPQGPILAYFKETQTPSDKWNTGPGQMANGDEEKIRIGEVIPGQVHFFPAICNAQMLRAEFEKRGCAKLN